MSDLKLSISGNKDIDAVLAGLPKQLSHRVLQAAHADAAKPLVTKAKLTAPEGPTGNLVDSIGVQRSRYNLVAKGTANIGEVNVGPRRGRYKGYAGHLVEFGTKARVTKGKGKKRRGMKSSFRGIMPKKPFMEPSFIATRSQVINNIAESIGKKLNAFMKRTIKKAA